MEIFAPLLGATALVVALTALVRPSNREVWRKIRPQDLAVYLLLAAAGVAVSLFHFDSIGNHAWRPHEEALWFALRGQVPPEGWNPLEVQTLVRLVYRAVGATVGTSIGVFGVTALVLGSGGVIFAGAAAQLITGSRWAGYGASTLLVFHPTLAYWRTNAFHVALPQAVFAAVLLAAVLVSRRPDRLNTAAWLILGSLCLYLRQEQLGAVLGTAAIPLFCGQKDLPKRWKVWLPGLLVAVVLLAIPSWENLSLAADREDYRMGLRFLPFYAVNLELWEPLSRPGLVALVALGLYAAVPRATVHARLRSASRALIPVTILSVVPSILFISFGQRHLLATGTAAVILAMVGGAALVSHPRLQRWRTPAITLAVGLVAITALDSWVGLMEWSPRYSQTDQSRVPNLPNTRVPSGPPVFNSDACATYASAWQLCSEWYWCHPPKDLTDPALVRARWDSQGGCVVWAVDERDGQVAGARHEWWTVVSRMYRWEPLGRLVLDDNGYEADIHVYRMTERP